MIERPKLSGCVITRNEADRIEDCLASLDFCDELIVVDSGSTDRTREIAEGFGARVSQHPFGGFGAQKNRAVELAANDWVLCLDADERVTPELREEITVLRHAGFPDKVGWSFPRLSNYLGTWVRRGTWYPDAQLRLYARRHAAWGGNPPHEKVLADGPVGQLTGDMQHYPYRTFDEHLATIDRYTTIMAKDMHERGRRAGALDLVLRPAVRFVRFYVLKLGFLLGWKGLLLACLAAHYVRLKYAKLMFLQAGEED